VTWMRAATKLEITGELDTAPTWIAERAVVEDKRKTIENSPVLPDGEKKLKRKWQLSHCMIVEINYLRLSHR